MKKLLPLFLCALFMGCEDPSTSRYLKCLHKANGDLYCRQVSGDIEAIKRVPGVLCVIGSDGYVTCENGKKYEVK